MIIGLVLISTLSAQAQTKAIGLRFNGGTAYGGTGLGGEISYQHGLSDANRLEFDLGFRSWRNEFRSNSSWMSLTGIYHWVWNIAAVDEGLNWYVGPGAQVGIYNWESVAGSNTEIGIGIGGQIGIEYDFSATTNVPLQLSLDTRPMFEVLNDGGFGYGGALGLRYRF